ncbi:hypothetical protein MTO96_035850 [Rhipicephalus appendiculatus]
MWNFEEYVELRNCSFFTYVTVVHFEEATDVTGALLVHPAASTCGRAVLLREWDRKSEGFFRDLSVASSTGKERKAATFWKARGPVVRGAPPVGGARSTSSTFVEALSASGVADVAVVRCPYDCGPRRRRAEGMEPLGQECRCLLTKGRVREPSSLLGLPTPASGDGPSRERSDRKSAVVVSLRGGEMRENTAVYYESCVYTSVLRNPLRVYL